jgi:hypothetical protein
MVEEIDETTAKGEPVVLGYHGPMGRWSLVRWNIQRGCWDMMALRLSGNYEWTGDSTDRLVKFFKLWL